MSEYEYVPVWATKDCLCLQCKGGSCCAPVGAISSCRKTDDLSLRRDGLAFCPEHKEMGFRVKGGLEKVEGGTMCAGCGLFFPPFREIVLYLPGGVSAGPFCSSRCADQHRDNASLRSENERLRIDLAAADKALNERTQENERLQKAIDSDHSRTQLVLPCLHCSKGGAHFVRNTNHSDRMLYSCRSCGSCFFRYRGGATLHPVAMGTRGVWLDGDDESAELRASLARVEAALQEKDEELSKALRPAVRARRSMGRCYEPGCKDEAVDCGPHGAWCAAHLMELSKPVTKSDLCDLCNTAPSDPRFHSPVSGHRCRSCAVQVAGLAPKSPSRIRGYATTAVQVVAAATLGAGAGALAWQWAHGAMAWLR